jgi:hypothetical protein
MCMLHSYSLHDFWLMCGFKIKIQVPKTTPNSLHIPLFSSLNRAQTTSFPFLVLPQKPRRPPFQPNAQSISSPAANSAQRNPADPSLSHRRQSAPLVSPFPYLPSFPTLAGRPPPHGPVAPPLPVAPPRSLVPLPLPPLSRS